MNSGDGEVEDEKTKHYFHESEWLAARTYRKLLVCQDGEVVETTCPVHLLCTEHYKNWELNNGLMIAYDPHARELNKWWEALRAKMPNFPQCSRMYGDIVVYVKGNALQWNELVLRRELINFLVCRYHKAHRYNFCEFK